MRTFAGAGVGYVRREGALYLASELNDLTKG
jgi:hypothetical protein